VYFDYKNGYTTAEYLLLLLESKLFYQLFVLAFGLRNYTVGHKKRATLLCTITSAFLDGFQHFVHQWKKE